MDTKNKLAGLIGKALVVISLSGLASVSLMAWWSPREVMALVGEQLTNTDSISSIRGIYGGVGIFIVVVLGFLWRIGLKLVLQFLAIFWLLYGASRIVTWIIDGPLGTFGRQWLIIELLLGVSCLMVCARIGKTSQAQIVKQNAGDK